MKLPVLIVDNVYFPTQRLRIKVDNTNSLLRNYQGNVFGIVGKSKDMTFRNMGVLVSIVKEESFLFEKSPFIRSYTDFVVECNKRIKILQNIKDLTHYDKTTQIVIAKVEVVDELVDESEIQEIKENKLDTTLKEIAIKYCTTSVLQQKAKAIQE